MAVLPFREFEEKVEAAAETEVEKVSALRSQADRAGDLALWLLIISGAAGAALGLAAAGRVACGIIAAGGLAVGLSIPWAVDGVNFLSGDDGFQFLQHFRTSVGGSGGDLVVLVLTLWVFMVFPFMNGIMCSIQRDEYRRIKRADPDIDVSVT